MNNSGADLERDFFVTGARTYLDVDDAMTEFRRFVRNHCRVVASKRLGEINRACEMEWTANDLKDYSWRQPDCFHVGKQIAVENLGGIYFCLEMYRENDSVASGTLVYLYRRRADLAIALWDRLDSTASDTAYCEGNSLIFKRLLSEDEIPDFPEHLNRTVDAFIAFIVSCGGLTKHLQPQGP